MAGSQQLNFAIKAVNEAGAQLAALRGDIDATGKAIDDADKKGAGFGKTLGDIGKIAGGFVLAQGIIKAPGFLLDAAKAAAEDEAATLRLEQALRNAGGAFDENLAKVNERIGAGLKLAFTDDDVRDSFQKLLAATGDTDEALRRQALAMDLSRGAGIPLAQASTLLGKVTAENVEVFKRMGITIGEGATEAEAFAAIQQKFAGQSEAYANSTAGQFEQVKIRMGEVKEQIGMALLPAMTKLGEVLLADVIPKVEQFANAIGPAIGKGIAFIQTEVVPVLQQFGAFFQTEILPKIQEFGASMQVEFQKFKGYIDSDLKPAFDNIKTVVTEVIEFVAAHWPEIEKIVKPVIDSVVAIIKTMSENIKLALQIIVDLLGGDFSGAWNKTKEIVSNTVDLWKTLVSNAGKLIVESLKLAWDLAKVAVQEGGNKIVDALGTLAGNIKTWVTGLAGDIAGWAAGVGRGLMEGLMSGIEFLRDWFIGQAKSFFSNLLDAAVPDWVSRSPSKIGIKTGMGFMQGVAAGMLAGAPLVAGAVALALAPAGASAQAAVNSGYRYGENDELGLYIGMGPSATSTPSPGSGQRVAPPGYVYGPGGKLYPDLNPVAGFAGGGQLSLDPMASKMAAMYGSVGGAGFSVGPGGGIGGAGVTSGSGRSAAEKAAYEALGFKDFYTLTEGGKGPHNIDVAGLMGLGEGNRFLAESVKAMAEQMEWLNSPSLARRVAASKGLPGDAARMGAGRGGFGAGGFGGGGGIVVNFNIVFNGFVGSVAELKVELDKLAKAVFA